MPLILPKMNNKALLTLLVLGGLAFFGLGDTWAQSVPSSADTPLKNFSTILSVVINIFTFLSFALIELSGDLFGTEWIIGSEIMEFGIRPMWIVIRNITNILFMSLLVILSFTNLFSGGITGNVGEWSIKQKLPKIILGLVAVNFSLIGFQWLVEGVHVGTVAVFSLADTALDARSATSVAETLTTQYQINDQGHIQLGQACADGVDASQCKTYANYLNEIFCPGYDSTNGNINERAAAQGDSSCLFALDGDNSFKSAQSSTAQNIILAFGTQFQHLERLPTLSAVSSGSWTEVSQDILFSAILSAMFVVALVVIFISLLFRMVVLWVAMVFSPLGLAAKILGFDIGKAGGGINFSKLLVMPIAIAGVFSVTFVMLHTMSEVQIFDGSQTFVKPGTALFSQGLYGLMWQVATLVIFWVGIKAATNGAASALDGITGKIYSGAENLGGYFARQATVDNKMFNIPTKDGSSMDVSLGMLGQIPQLAVDQQRRKQRQDLNSLSQELFPTGDASQQIRSSLAELKARENRVNEAKYLETAIRESKNVGQKGGSFADIKKDMETYYKDNAEALKILNSVSNNATPDEWKGALDRLGKVVKNPEKVNIKTGDVSEYKEGGTNTTPAGDTGADDNTSNKNTPREDDQLSAGVGNILYDKGGAQNAITKNADIQTIAQNLQGNILKGVPDEQIARLSTEDINTMATTIAKGVEQTGQEDNIAEAITNVRNDIVIQQSLLGAEFEPKDFNGNKIASGLTKDTVKSIVKSIEKKQGITVKRDEVAATFGKVQDQIRVSTPAEDDEKEEKKEDE